MGNALRINEPGGPDIRWSRLTEETLLGICKQFLTISQQSVRQSRRTRNSVCSFLFARRIFFEVGGKESNHEVCPRDRSVLCSNAAEGGPGPPTDAAKEMWQKQSKLHVMVHIYAARALLPTLLERDESLSAPPPDSSSG